MSDYLQFLKEKVITAPETGFHVELSDIHPALQRHQPAAVQWALKGGRRALFESFGLGKTIQELEFCRQVVKYTGGRALLICPLGVRQEFARDAVHLLRIQPPRYVRNMKEVREANTAIVITNYERVINGDIDPREFAACGALDEAAVLRSFGSKTYQTSLELFRGIPFKILGTAMPAPNRFKELIHYAGFLEVMDTGQALTRFFQRDSTKANNLTLYPHKEDEFWMWVSTWALFINKPSDLGFTDEGYDLPPLDIRFHEVGADHSKAGAEKDGQGKLFRDAAEGLPAAAREKRDSLEIRITKAAELVAAEPDQHVIIWHDLEDERHAIKKAIPETVDIYGSQDLDEREKRTVDFAEGRIKRFATKKILSGSGSNFQRHCHWSIFVGIDEKFHDFLQAVHRTYRFLQKERCRVDLIFTDSERKILNDLMDKWRRHDHMQAKMTEIIRKYGLNHSEIINSMTRAIGVERVEIKKEGYYTAVNNDCVLETQRMEANSVGLIHTSIPFANHYEYTPSYNDFGHTSSNAHFWAQMDHLTPELLRVLQPGRIAAIHVKDRILFGNATGDGMPTCDSFHEETSLHFQRHGFRKIGMITIDTDVVRENNQTYRLGWTEQCKDGSKMGVGCPEYILLFRKLPSDTSRAYADVPVTKSKEDYTRAQWQLDAHAHWKSSGDRLLSKDELAAIPVEDLQRVYRQFSRESVYSYAEHVELAKQLDENGKLPATFMVVAPGSRRMDIWDDINRMRTLNMDQQRKNRQMHVCPLQLDIVERIINRYSNKGDVVLDPFGGLGTVSYMAIKMGRQGYTIELNPDYFRDSIGYLESAIDEVSIPSLFDFMEGKDAA